MASPSNETRMSPTSRPAVSAGLPAHDADDEQPALESVRSALTIAKADALSGEAQVSAPGSTMDEDVRGRLPGDRRRE